MDNRDVRFVRIGRRVIPIRTKGDRAAYTRGRNMAAGYHASTGIALAGGLALGGAVISKKPKFLLTTAQSLIGASLAVNLGTGFYGHPWRTKANSREQLITASQAIKPLLINLAGMGLAPMVGLHATVGGYRAWRKFDVSAGKSLRPVADKFIDWHRFRKAKLVTDSKITPKLLGFSK